MLIIIVDDGLPMVVKKDNYDTINNIENQDGHGVAIYNIIKKGCGSFADILNISISELSYGVNEEVLIEALVEIEKKYKPDIINLSLGISQCVKKEKLREICDILNKKGATIISAFNNDGSISYPAGFNNVIGVVSGQNCRKTDDFEMFCDDLINIGAKGDIQRVVWNNSTTTFLSGNSLACAHVTVQWAKFIHQGYKSKEAILGEFSKIAIKSYPALYYKKNKGIPFSIHEAIVFPFNKEIHSLARFYENLDFKISNFYDTKYSGNVGSSIQLLLKDENAYDGIVQNVDEINWDDTFDTIIIGHIGQMQSLIKRNIFADLYRSAQKYKKKIYSFDDLSNIYPESNNLFYPKIEKKDIPPNRLGKLYRISKPVLGIFGTSSKQGKFSLQIQLYNKLKRKGYQIGRIGTEASSLLFGMNYVYPMGYNSSVYIRDYDAILYLNDIMNSLTEENDLIMVGSQSGTVEYDFGNISQYNFPQRSFLLGTLPDAVVLCVNAFDDEKYIKRTINYLESSVDCDVVAIVLFPMTIDEKWNSIYQVKRKMSLEEQERTKVRLTKSSNIPVYSLDCNQDIENLSELIIETFSSEIYLKK